MTYDTAQLEALLPTLAYGNLLAEDPAQLTMRHFRCGCLKNPTPKP